MPSVVRSRLTTVVGMDNITAIGNYMFTACSALTSVADLSKVTSVGYSGIYELFFADCAGRPEFLRADEH